MRCPICRIDNDRVIDSRISSEGFAIRRRRECVSCGRRYTTYERIERAVVRVAKKDGTRVPFDRDKIRLGLTKACWKRPVTDEQIEQLVAKVEAEIYDSFESEVDTRQIGELVTKHLGRLDQVALVRFASVYREFTDVRDFIDELQPLLDEVRPRAR